MNEKVLDLSCPRILLAEGDPDFRELLAFFLLRAGYSVRVRDNGLELLEYLNGCRGVEERFDLVVTDVRMSALTELEVPEALHNQPDPRSCA